MATNCSCCVFNNAPAIDLNDPCVCNAPIGAVLVTTLSEIYVRTSITVPCALTDWTLNSGFTFNISDAFANIQSIASGETITFLGQNGVDVKVSTTDTVTISGLTTFGTGAPAFVPIVPTDVNLYLDTTTGYFYVWSPVGPTWVGPITSGSSSVVDAICAVVEGVYDPTLSLKVFQDQTGICKVVRHLHKPVAAFEVTKRAALTMTLDAASSNSTIVGSSLTYSWTSSAGVGVFSSTTVQAPDLIFTSPGEYTVTLTVTDSFGTTNSITKIFSVDYILHVMGDFAQNESFTTLQAAFNWINTNDPGNDTLYTIHVWGTTLDAAIITANEAVVQFQEQGRILVSVVFPANQSFVWNGVAKSGAHFNIETPDIAIQVANGSALELNNISLNYLGATYVIDLNGFNVLTLNNVRMLGTAGVTAQGTGGFVEIRNSEILTTTTALNLLNYEIKLKDLYIATTQGPTCIELNNCYGIIDNTTVNSTQSVAQNAVALQIIPSTTDPLEITHSTFKMEGFHPGFYQAGATVLNASGQVTFSNCTIVGEDVGYLAVNNVSLITVYTLNNFIYGGTVSIIATSTYPAITVAVYGPMNFYNNVFRGPVGGGVTFAAGIPLPGSNINV